MANFVSGGLSNIERVLKGPQPRQQVIRCTPQQLVCWLENPFELPCDRVCAHTLLVIGPATPGVLSAQKVP